MHTQTVNTSPLMSNIHQKHIYISKIPDQNQKNTNNCKKNLRIKIKDRFWAYLGLRVFMTWGFPIFPKTKYSNISGVLVTLIWEFGNMRSDHVIYLPSSQNATYDPGKISKRSLRDTFILDRNCLATNKPDEG